MCRLSVFFCLACGFAICSDAVSGTLGEVQGVVSDSFGRPLSPVSILVVGTDWGTVSQPDGTFEVDLPEGYYSLDFLMKGYTAVRVDSVHVRAGEKVYVPVRMKMEILRVQMPVLAVRASKPLIEPSRTETVHRVKAVDLASMPVDDLLEAIDLKAGVIAQAGELHFRGGRAGEVMYQIDGVPVKDPLSGASATLATLAVAESEVLLGGLEAKYGNAQSGVVNFVTKEGGSRFSGEIRYVTDDFGSPRSTYENFDRAFVGFGGPLGSYGTWYASVEGTWSDSYPATRELRSAHRFLDLVSLRARKVNTVRLQCKLALKPTASTKLTLELISNRSNRDRYYHMWSRDGYVVVYVDTLQTGEVGIRHGGLERDSIPGSIYYNAAAHTPNVAETFAHWRIALSQTLGSSGWYSLKLSKQHFYMDDRVNGKRPWEYDGARDMDFWYDYRSGSYSPFFVVWGDYPRLATRDTRTYSARFEMGLSGEGWEGEWGWGLRYNDMRYEEIVRPYATDASGAIGSQHTRYHCYNPEGEAYVQASIEYEGMLLKPGVRLDYFRMADQIPISEAPGRVLTQVSPRIGLTYPISDRDVFSFHYGRFCQLPNRSYLFDRRDARAGGIAGNPQLSTEMTISYQAGVQHLFSRTLAVSLSVYYKDIFGLIAAERVRDVSGVDLQYRWVNRDYASAKGIEITISRGHSRTFRFEVSYTYSLATGTASDPEAAAVRDFLYIPTSEQPLDWDVRHSLSLSVFLSQPGSWGCSFLWSYHSGFPFTPIGRDTRRVDPMMENSRRLPSCTDLGVQFEKYFKLAHGSLRFFLQARNLLDARNIALLAPPNWPAPPSRVDYTVYYTETGMAGGAYLVGEGGREHYVPLDDPRVFAPPRVIRAGLGVEF